MLEYEKQPTISSVYGIVDGLKNFVANYEKGTSEIEDLCSVLSNQLDSRFNFMQDDPLFLVSTLVDPATSAQLNLSESNKAKKILVQWVSVTQTNFVPNNRVQVNELKDLQPTDAPTPIPPVTESTNPLERFLQNRGVTTTQRSTDSTVATVSTYVSETRAIFSALIDKGTGSEVKF